MSEPKIRKATWACITMTLMLPYLFYPPLAAEIARPEPDHHMGTWSKPFQTAAIVPSRPDASAPLTNETRKDGLRERLNGAKAILKDLKTFADTAQRAIDMGQKLKTTRLNNQHLKQNIAKHTIKKNGIEHNLSQIQRKVSSLTETVVANWLSFERLNDQNAADHSRLALTRTAWLATEYRLISLQKRLAEQRTNARDLRAKSAALAAEIGRTRRQIVNLGLERRLASADRQVIKLTTKQLRHGVLTNLQTILSTD